MDHVPESVVRAAYGVFERRDARAVVADEVPALRVDRDQGPTRRVTFRTRDLEIQVEVHLSHGLLGLCIELRPPAVLSVEVRHEGAPLHGRSDAHGRCLLAPVQQGLVSLLLTPPCDRAVMTATAWVVL